MYFIVMTRLHLILDQLEQMPFPMTIGGFKGHPLYVVYNIMKYCNELISYITVAIAGCVYTFTQQICIGETSTQV